MLAVSACHAARQPAAGARSALPTSASTFDSLWAVAALGESDAWAVGTRVLGPGASFPLTEHWDGQSWKVVPSPSHPPGIRGQTRSSLDAVAVDAPDDAWAVGHWSAANQVPPEQALIEHWNGTKWSVVPGPRSGGQATDLTAVAAISPKQAWAIGYGTVRGRASMVFMGWNGTSWRHLPSPIGTFPGGLAVISASDIWLAGEEGAKKSAATYHTVLEHWDGSKWKIVPAPNQSKGGTSNVSLSAAGGSSSSNVWAVGHYQPGQNGSDVSPLVEHWNGSKWQLQKSQAPTSARGQTGFDAIAALSGSCAFAVGSAWSSNGPIPLIERWDGTRWTAMTSGLRPGVTGPTLDGVAAVHPSYAWAVGDAYTQGNRSITLIEKWNGSAWQQVPSPNP